MEVFNPNRRMLIKIREAGKLRADALLMHPVSIRRALKFDGVDDGVRVLKSDSLLNRDAVSVALWIKPLSYDPSKHSGRNAVFIHRVGLRIWTLSSTIIANEYTDGTVFQGCNVNYEMGQWHHYVTTYDKNEGYIRTYVNSVLKVAKSFSVSLLDGNRDIMLGKEEGNPREWNGMISEARVYNRALSEAEIKWLYNNGRGRPGQVGIREGCVLCLDPSRWRGANYVKDISGCGNHGIIYGALRVRCDI